MCADRDAVVFRRPCRARLSSALRRLSINEVPQSQRYRQNLILTTLATTISLSHPGRIIVNLAPRSPSWEGHIIWSCLPHLRNHVRGSDEEGGLVRTTSAKICCSFGRSKIWGQYGYRDTDSAVRLESTSAQIGLLSQSSEDGSEESITKRCREDEWEGNCCTSATWNPSFEPPGVPSRATKDELVQEFKETILFPWQRHTTLFTAILSVCGGGNQHYR